MSKKQPIATSHSASGIKVTGIRKDKIDTKRLAEVYLMAAQRRVEERKSREDKA